jgi:predicted kinase
MSRKPILTVIVGLPASGKSTLATKISQSNDAFICSSDSIREELFGDINHQDDNETVFNELHKRIKTHLRNGDNVIYDACNVNSRRRKAFLDQLKKIPCEKQCVIMATHLGVCIVNNETRDRRIPKDVIYKMYKSWDTPYYFEGWDKILIEYDNDTQILSAGTWITEHMSYSQDNHHHTKTLGEHCAAVANALKGESNLLYYAGLLHDCGKPFTKSFANYKGEVGEDAHYYGHEHCGAYDALFFDYPYYINPIDVSILIGLHMRPYFWEKDKQHGEKLREKYRRLWGMTLHENVMKLHSADRNAH